MIKLKKYARVSSRIESVWNKLITLHILWGDDSVSIEVPAAATTPTPAVAIDVVAAALAVWDICWTVVELDELETESEFETELEIVQT